MRSIAFANAPDPGQDQAVGSADGLGIVRERPRSAPTRSNAFSTERRLPIP